MLWGMVFVAPLMLPDYPASVLTAGRYLAFGLLSIALARLDWHALQTLKRQDWIEAVKLSLIGNLLYYGLLAAAIQTSGAPVPTMLIGTLPVVIAVCSNLGDRSVAWMRLAPPLLLIAVGVGLVQYSELDAGAQASSDWGSRVLGAMLAIGAVACWTWYPIRNARWLQSHSDTNSSAWATAQGLATLPLALILMLILWLISLALPGSQLGRFDWPLGSTPLKYLGMMILIGLCASWLGTLLWNRSSQLLPTALGGQLIVFETLAALAYAYILRDAWPPLLAWLGIVFLLVGVVAAIRVFRRPVQPSPVSHA
jgi:drug/metabolite transporter (DMT)-like permease